MEKELNLLRKIADSDTRPHAFLFVGANGVGKFEAAIEFAKYLNCALSPKFNQGEICVCEQCKMIDKGIHPDVYIIEKQPERKEIVDSQIINKEKKEGIIYKINNSPVSGKFNIVIIKNAELMNKTVSNTILKGLEEPKNNTIFILTTNNKKNILPTIISRCLVVDFRLLTKEEMGALVQGEKSKDIDLIYDLSSGKYKKAIELCNKDILDQYISDIKEFANILRSADYEKISYISKILEDKTKLEHYTYIWELVFVFYILKKHEDLIGQLKLVNIEENMKKLYNLRNAIAGNYILDIWLINFLLEIS